MKYNFSVITFIQMLKMTINECKLYYLYLLFNF